jgi:hypothetical protein
MKLFASLIFFSLVWGSTLPALSQLGTPFSMKTFKPFLDRGYNTLLGWNGRPVTLEDPHLHLYASEGKRLFASVEFGLRQKEIETVVLKLNQPYAKFGFAEDQELDWFLLLTTQAQITPKQVKTAFAKRKPCNSSEFKLDTAPARYLTVYSDYQSTYVRVSQRGSAKAPQLERCP